MLEKILNIINEQAIEDYSIVIEQRQSSELFFIKNNLDLTRAKDVKEARVTVYRKFEINDKKYMGSSMVYIYPQTSQEQTKELIKDAYESALNVANPDYDLIQGVKEDVIVIESGLAKRSLADNAIAMAKALYEAANIYIDENNKQLNENIENEINVKLPQAWINSSEFFATKKSIRIVNSKGCDVSYEKYGIEGEFVVQSKLGDNDVELYNSFDYDELAADELKQKCISALKTVKDRALAKAAPEDLSKYPIILCEEYVGQLLDFYMSRTNAASVYPGYSDYKEGVNVAPAATAHKINITGMVDVPYTMEGVKKEEHTLIKDGTVMCLHGNNQYSSYLGIKQVGTYTKKRCDNEGIELEKLKQKPYIMVKNFSDFQVDAMDGHFGGEFRLAYLFDGENEIAITGGTVSGNLLLAHNNLVFSKERYSSSSYEGPMAVRLG